MAALTKSTLNSHPSLAPGETGFLGQLGAEMTGDAARLGLVGKGYSSGHWETCAGTVELRSELCQGSYVPGCLEPRRMVEEALMGRCREPVCRLYRP